MNRVIDLNEQNIRERVIYLMQALGVEEVEVVKVGALARIAELEGKQAAVPRARRSDPSTSHQAAASVGPLRDNQRAVLSVLQHFGPLTDEKLVTNYEATAKPHGSLPAQSPSGIRTRRRELVDRKLVADTSKKERMTTGRMAILWAANG